jgi:hypothetical protein
VTCEAEHICAGRRTLDNDDDDRVRERGKEQPKGKLCDAGPDERTDHPWGKLGTRQLEGHERDREDNSDEGKHRRGDDAQKRFSGACPDRQTPSDPGKCWDRIRPRNCQPDGHPCDEQRSWYDPEPFTKPLLREHKPESIPGFWP